MENQVNKSEPNKVDLKIKADLQAKSKDITKEINIKELEELIKKEYIKEYNEEFKEEELNEINEYSSAIYENYESVNKSLDEALIKLMGFCKLEKK